MKINRDFLFLGLDFLFDEKGRIYFLEVNSFPGLLRNFDSFYGRSLLEPMVKMSLKLKLPIIRVYTKEAMKKWDKPLESFEKMKQLGADCRLVILKSAELEKFNGKLIDTEGRKISKGIIFRPYPEIQKYFQNKSAFYLVNSLKTVNIARDKFKTAELIARAGIRTPKVFRVKNIQQVQEAARKLNLKEIVLKPRFGQQGIGVKLVKNFNRLNEVDFKGREFLAQERINVPKEGRYFWDVRAFTFDGKYLGATKRVSRRFVANLSLGGKSVKLPAELEPIVKRMSEKCVKVLRGIY